MHTETPRELLDRAVTLHQGGEFRASIPFYIRAVRGDEGLARAEGRGVDPDILHAAGVALAMGGKRAEAIQFLEAAIAGGKGRSGACWSALGLAYVESRDLGRAERCYRLACRFDPDSVANWTGYANLAACGGDLPLAERRYQLALNAHARDAEELIAQGMTQLRQGKWRTGWRNYEARSQTAMWTERNSHAAKLRAGGLSHRTWWNHPTAEDHLYVIAEQGMGDTVQFARYLRDIHPRVKSLVLGANPSLIELLTPALSGICSVQSHHDDPPEGATAWALLLSVPAILRVHDPKVVPEAIRPFGLQWSGLHHVPRGTGGTRVFVHSRGNAAHGYDFDRSAPADLIEQMVRSAGHTVVTAGFGEHATAGQGVSVRTDPSWRETVDTLLTCDRCVTVDTGLAHVAGSLGIPMDLIVPTICEWRWGNPKHTRTPWYPTARLWHRTRTDQWKEVIANIISSWG